MKSFARALILSTALAATLPAMALEIKGAKFGDTYQVANQSLQLNGAGIRVKMVFDVYAAGLYVTKKDSNAAGLISQAGAKGMQIVLLRNLKLLEKEFDAEGIDIELVTFDGGSAASVALGSGQLDLMYTGNNPALRLAASGADVVAVV